VASTCRSMAAPLPDNPCPAPAERLEIYYEVRPDQQTHRFHGPASPPNVTTTRNCSPARQQGGWRGKPAAWKSISNRVGTSTKRRKHLPEPASQKPSIICLRYSSQRIPPWKDSGRWSSKGQWPRRERNYHGGSNSAWLRSSELERVDKGGAPKGDWS
jgi:hypothetical protein